MAEEFDYLLKICIFADKNVGKKTLAKSDFLGRHFEDYITTTGVELTSKDFKFDGEIFRITIWIISDDRERFQHIWKSYISGSQGIILMYDITNAQTLNGLSEWCQLAKNYKEDIPILLVGNKLDLEMKKDVSKAQIENFKLNNEISESMEISLETGENVEKMFLRLIAILLNKVDGKKRKKKK